MINRTKTMLENYSVQNPYIKMNCLAIRQKPTIRKFNFMKIPLTITTKTLKF